MEVLNNNGYDLVFGGFLPSGDWFVGQLVQDAVTWSNQIATSNNTYKPTGLAGITYSLNKNYVIVGTTGVTSTLVFNATTGALVSASYISPSGTSSVFYSSTSYLINDSVIGSEKIYVVYVSKSQIYILCYTMASVPIWQSTITDTSRGQTVYMPFSVRTSLYIGGQFKGSGNKFYATLLKVNAATGAIQSQYFMRATTQIAYEITQIELDSNQVLFGCLEAPVSASKTYIGIFYSAGVTNKAYHYQVGTSFTINCMSVTGVTTVSQSVTSMTVSYRLLSSNSNYYAISTVTFGTSTSLVATYTPFFNKFFTYSQAVTITPYFYYVGNFGNQASSGFSVDKYGFIMSNRITAAGVCVPTDSPYSQTHLEYSSTNAMIIDLTQNPPYVTSSGLTYPINIASSITRTTVNLTQYQNTTTCNMLGLNKIQTTPTVIQDVILDVSDGLIPTTVSTIYSNYYNCTDATYAITLTCNSSSCPSWVLYQRVSNTDISIQYTPPNTKQTYVATLTNILDQYHSTYLISTFNIFVRDRCDTKTVTYPTIASQSYTEKNTALNISTLFTCNYAYCLNNMTYTVTLQSGSVLPAFIEFDSTLKQINVYSESRTDTGVYPIMIKILNSYNSTDLYYKNFTLTVIDYCTLMTVTTPTILSAEYEVMSPIMDIPYANFVSSPVECIIDFIYSARLLNGSVLPSFIKFLPLQNKFTVYSELNSSADLYDIQLKISNGSGLVFTSLFSVNITEFDFCLIKVVTPPIITNKTYTAMQPALSFTHDVFLSNSTWCMSAFAYSAKLTNGSALPSFITYDAINKNFTLQTDLNSDADDYEILVSYSDGIETYTASFFLIVSEYDECAIKTMFNPTISTQAYSVYGSRIYVAVDSFSSNPSYCLDNFTETLTYLAGALPPAVTYEPTNRSLSIYTLTNSEGGTFPLDLTITDGSQVYTHSFNVVISTIDLCTVQVVTSPTQSDIAYTVNSALTKVQHSLFTTNQAGCLSSFTYASTLIDNSVLPSFLTYTTTNRTLSIYTVDNLDVNTYTLKISLSSLTYPTQLYSFSFSLSVSFFDFCTLKTVSVPSILDQSYTVNSAQLQFTHTAFTSTYPSLNCLSGFTQSAVMSDGSPINSFISYQPVSNMFVISTGSNLYKGDHLIKVQITDGIDTYKSNTFTLTVIEFNYCTLSYVSAPLISDQTYTVNSQQLNLTHSLFTADPNQCDISSYTYSAKLANGSALPSFIKYYDLTHNFEIYTVDNLNQGVYNISVSLSNGSTILQTFFQVSVLYFDFCTIQTVTSPAVSDKIYLLEETPLLFFHSDFTSNYASCISAYTLNVALQNGSALPAFIKYDQTMKQFNVSGAIASDIGTYPLRLSLSNTTVTYTSDFTLTVNYANVCQIQTITPPVLADQVYTVFDSQLLYQHDIFSSTPNQECMASYTLEATLSNGGSLPTFITYDPATLQLKVQTNENSQAGVYQLKVTAYQGADLFVSNIITITISPLICSSKTLTVIPTITDQTYTVDDTAMIVQHDSFSGGSPANCFNNFTLKALKLPSYTQLPSHIQYSSTNRQFTIYSNDNSTSGTYSISLIYYNSQAPSDKYEVHFTVTIIGKDWCSDPTTLIVAKPSITNQVYQVNSGTQALSHALFVTTPTYCASTSYTLSSMLSDLSALPSFVSYNSTQHKYSINSVSNSDAGTYTLILRFENSLTGYSYDVQWTLQVTQFDYCAVQVVTVPIIANQVYAIGNIQKTVTHTAFTTNTTSCFDSGYVLTATMQDGSAIDSAVIQYSANDMMFTIYSTDNTKAKTYAIRLSYSNGFQSYSKDFLITVSFVNPCLSALVTPPFLQDLSYDLSSPPLEITMPLFLSSPVDCIQDYFSYSAKIIAPTVSPLPNWIKYTVQNNSISIYTQNENKIGTYTIRITVTSQSQQTYSSSFKLTVLPQGTCTPLQQLNKPVIRAQTYTVWNRGLEVLIPPFTTKPATCISAFQLSHIMSDGSPLKSFITVDTEYQKYVISTFDNSDAGTYQIRLKLSNGQDTYFVDWTLTIVALDCTNKIVFRPKIPNKEWNMLDPPMTFKHPTFSGTPVGCFDSYNYESIDVDLSSLPPFIQYDSVRAEFTVGEIPPSYFQSLQNGRRMLTSSIIQTGNYTIRLTYLLGGDSYFTDFVVQIVEIVNTFTPNFSSLLPNGIDTSAFDYLNEGFSVNSLGRQTIPILTSDDPNVHAIVLLGGLADLAATYENGQIVLTTNMDTQSGTYYATVTIVTTDENGIQRRIPYDFPVTVNIDPATGDYEASYSANTNGQEVYYSGLTPEQEANLQETIKASISSISRTGLVKIQFTDKIRQPRGLIDKPNPSGFEMSVIPGGLRPGLNTTLKSYTVKKVLDKEMQLQIEFNDPKQISTMSTFDSLEIIIKNNFLIISQDGTKTTKKNYVLRKVIPMLTTKDSQESAKALGDFVDGVVTTAVMGAFFMGLPMNDLWKMLSILQLITITPLFNIATPSNFKLFCGYLIACANMDLQILPTKQWISSGLTYLVEKASNTQPQVAQVGYQTKSFLMNISNMFYNIFIMGLIGLFILSLRLCTKRSAVINWIYLKLSRKFFFNSYIGAFLMGYLNFSFVSLLQLSESDDDPAMVAGKVFSSVILIAIFSAPILVMYLFIRCHKQLRQDTFRNRLGVLYIGIKLDSFWNLMWIEIYMVRRLIIAFVIVYLQDYPFMQLWINIGFSFLYLFYINWLRPFQFKIDIYLETYNELTFLAVSTFIFGFADTITDIDARERIGSFLIAIIAIMLSVNFIIWIRNFILTIIRLIQTFKKQLQQICQCLGCIALCKKFKCSQKLNDKYQKWKKDRETKKIVKMETDLTVQNLEYQEDQEINTIQKLQSNQKKKTVRIQGIDTKDIKIVKQQSLVNEWSNRQDKHNEIQSLRGNGNDISRDQNNTTAINQSTSMMMNTEWAQDVSLEEIMKQEQNQNLYSHKNTFNESPDRDTLLIQNLRSLDINQANNSLTSQKDFMNINQLEKEFGLSSFRKPLHNDTFRDLSSIQDPQNMFVDEFFEESKAINIGMGPSASCQPPTETLDPFFAEDQTGFNRQGTQQSTAQPQNKTKQNKKDKTKTKAKKEEKKAVVPVNPYKDELRNDKFAKAKKKKAPKPLRF